MGEKIKNEIITIGFVLILLGVFVMNLIKPDETISTSERRKLAQFPTITKENLTSGKTAEQFDQYTVDQFIFRDTFRSIKSFWSASVFRQKDNNGLFLLDGNIYKIEYPLNQKNVEKTAGKIKNINDKYLNENMKVYYAIIPDKNYYLEADYLKINVPEMQKVMQAKLPENMEYIDITGALSLQDYYKTDLHWKQENLKNVVSVLEDKMGLNNSSKIEYDVKDYGDFYGSYYGQLGRRADPDTIKVLENATIQNATTYNEETKKNGQVYDTIKWQTSSDKYDIYLSGATPLITIENPSGPEGKELLLFRDSFGSSIAPLLLENYQKITLIDLRYISSTILNQYVEFNHQDVLFLYSTLIINQNVFK